MTEVWGGDSLITCTCWPLNRVSGNPTQTLCLRRTNSCTGGANGKRVDWMLVCPLHTTSHLSYRCTISKALSPTLSLWSLLCKGHKYFGSDIFPPCSQKKDTSLANFAFGDTMLIAWNQPWWDYLHHWQKQPVRMSGDQNTDGYWRSSGSEFLHQEKCLLTIPNPSSILPLEQNLENTNLTKAFHVNLFLLPFALKFSFQIHSLTHLVSWGHYKPFFIP